MTEKKYKRILYCERCEHPEDRHAVADSSSLGCAAKTVKPGAPKCKCPQFVRPTGGYMASISQCLKKEAARSGTLPYEEVATERR
jgi:hypothetical protein